MREQQSATPHGTARLAVTGTAMVVLAGLVGLWSVGAVTLPTIGIGGTVVGGILGAITAGREPPPAGASERLGSMRRPGPLAVRRR